LSLLVYPVQFVVNVPIMFGVHVADNFAFRTNLIDENRDLIDENRMLRSRTQKFAALTRENERLRELLDSSSELGEHVIEADVLAIESTPSSRQVVVNKGSRHRVYVGQPIVDAHGVLGQIVHVAPFSSTALLITDSRHAIPVQINRSGLRALAVGGDLPDEIQLSFVPTNGDVRAGDLVVTSGLGQRFPPGYPVGQVKDVRIEAGEPFAEIIVIPSAHVEQSREILLVWPEQSEISSERVLVTDQGTP